ncbi:MAG: GNAT family N-acetyltransferase [Verrucomicrobiae bacterium]|nr:GNAT family N-acetyltransferase [Verrucomicrobiae bacterium]
MPIVAEITTTAGATGWDAFLEGSILGQFQQSAAWAGVKAVEGWDGLCMVLKREGRIAGGAQVLHKRTRFGRLAFVNKGPVVEPGDMETREEALRQLVTLQRREGWRALLVQGPDGDPDGLEPLRRHGFVEERLMNIIDSTLMIDLGDGWEAVRGRFRRKARRNLRPVADDPLTVVEGGEADLETFFELMRNTCRRQGVRPNPGRIEGLRAMWEGFHPQGRIHVPFVERRGRKVAGGLCFCFRDRVTFWKKGWDPEGGGSTVNFVLTAEVIRWAAERGYRWLDFATLDRDIAQAMARGEEPPEDLTDRRDFFNLSFGGQAHLLPGPMIRLANPVAALGYRLATSGPLLRRAQRVLRRLAVN